jgi:hypothetical protein
MEGEAEMPKSSPAKLDYQKAYNARPDQKALGVERRRTRRHLIAEGKVAIGDGKDIAHKVAADNGGKMTPKNIKIEDAKTNRAWRKSSGYRVPTDK